MLGSTSIGEMVIHLIAEVMTAFWFFFFGAAIGSFLNVVVWRLPKKQNLLWPPSACPVCGHRLGLKDNLPIVGWLMLRGRCRYCQTKIASSYLWVESFCGLITLLLLYLVVHSGGSTLPLRNPNAYGGAMWTILYPKQDLLLTFAYYMSLVLSQFTLLLFALHDERLPFSIVLLSMAVALGLPLLHLPVHQVPWDGVVDKLRFGNHLGIAEASIGLVAGAILGCLFRLILRSRTSSMPSLPQTRSLPTSFDIPLLLTLAGAYLGWQAVISIGMLSAILCLLSPFRTAYSVLVFVGTLVHLVLWRMTTQHATWWPGVYTSLPVMALFSVLSLLLVWLRCKMTNYSVERKSLDIPKG